jgi:hypothetical protein
MTQSKKVVKKAVKRVEKVEPVIAPPVEEPAKPVDKAAKLQAMLAALKLNDARSRLERAKDGGNPDEILARMDEVFKLEND